jgi:hypothetical protein
MTVEDERVRIDCLRGGVHSLGAMSPVIRLEAAQSASPVPRWGVGKSSGA